MYFTREQYHSIFALMALNDERLYGPSPFTDVDGLYDVLTGDGIDGGTARTMLDLASKGHADLAARVLDLVRQCPMEPNHGDFHMPPNLETILRDPKVRERANSPLPILEEAQQFHDRVWAETEWPQDHNPLKVRRDRLTYLR